MINTKKSNVLIALLLLATTFSSHKTQAMESIEPSSWVTLAGAAILGGYVAYQQFLSYVHKKSTESSTFTALPPEIQYFIIDLLAKNSTATTITEAGKTINALAQTNSELNALINNPQFCFRIIKNLAKQFDCSDQEAAEALQTQEAKKRLDIQKQFLHICDQKNFNEQVFNDLYKKHTGYVDLNFTYTYIVALSKLRKTLLFMAIDKRNCPLIQSLLNHGADVNKVNFKGHTPLMTAVYTDKTDMIQCLLSDPNIAINQQNNEGQTALMYATRVNNLPIMQILLTHGASVNKATMSGETALDIAAHHGKVDAVEYLLDRTNTAVDQQDNNGNTALLATISSFSKNENKLIIIKLLLNANADSERANNKGLTPLKAAQQTGNQEIIDLIQNAIDKKHGKK